MRFLTATLLTLLSVPAFAQTQSKFQFFGYVSAREIYVKSQPSWTEGGIGRFDVGTKSVDDHHLVNLAVAQVGLDWTPVSWFLVHADGVVRREPSGTKGNRGGLVEGYADLYNDHWRLRGGSFWLPTSRENIDPLWTSRYTITYSALNSWIAQEVRPIGVDLQYSPSFYITLGATAFRGNDTMGTELAARGWTLGNRISTYDENIPLPEPETSTRPVGRDLDGRNGYSGRVRLQLPERAMIQFTHIDNRAPLVGELHGQEPWKTRFNIVGATIGTTGPNTLAGEWSSGSTGVGFPGGSFTMDFDTAYLLVSHKSGSDRLSARVERFSTRAHIHSADDGSREHGTAATVAWFREPNPKLRYGLEYARVKGDRAGVAERGFDPRMGGSTVTVEVRYGF